jgi:Domain of unknown function (DUF4728)
LQIGNLLAVLVSLGSFKSILKYLNHEYLIVDARPIFIPLIVAIVIGLIVSILLIIGAKNNKPALLIPYVVFTIIGIVIEIYFTTFSILHYELCGVSAGKLSCFIPPFTVLLQIFFSLVVIGFYKQQKAENQLKKRQNSEATV